MIIRPMAKEDLGQAAWIEASCFRESWSEEVLRESFGKPWNLFYVAEEGGGLAGYGAACAIAGEGEIQRLAVLPPFRQRGLGRELLEKLEEALREKGVGAIALEVRESNIPARKLYISAGFQEEARRKDYYRNPKEDGIIMWNRGRP